jgi:hypothetical protein
VQGLWKLFVVLGTCLVLVGLALRLGWGRWSWIGHLPGDLRIGDSVYIPLATCAVISVVLTLVINVLTRLLGK